jgi:hypothetical protein
MQIGRSNIEPQKITELRQVFADAMLEVQAIDGDILDFWFDRSNGITVLFVKAKRGFEEFTQVVRFR